jgi:hypothetical protein
MTRLVLCALTLMAMSNEAAAMDVAVAGNQLILSGRVIGNEYERVARLLAADARITTVVLRNSPGGHAGTGYRLGELFRARGLNTAVSGFCYSSCSRMFLGGRQRSFTDDFPQERTEVGFHGHYGRDGRLLPDLVRKLDLKAWIIRHSDGRADAELVERWINIPRGAGMIHFFHPGLVQRHGVSTVLCQGDEETSEGVFGCEPISRTAVDLGIVTTLALTHGNDQAAVRAAHGLK